MDSTLYLSATSANFYPPPPQRYRTISTPALAMEPLDILRPRAPCSSKEPEETATPIEARNLALEKAEDLSSQETAAISSVEAKIIIPKETEEILTEHPQWLEYTSELPSLPEFLNGLVGHGIHHAFAVVKFLDLKPRYIVFPGKNKAQVYHDPEGCDHVFKGIELSAFLEHDSHFHVHQRETMLHEIQTLAALPAHPNIMPCPEILVVVDDAEGNERICGFLQPIMAKGTLNDQVIKANKVDRRVPLAQQAKWCHGMARAVMHTHRVGDTYHMDLKPGNTLIDDTDEIRLIDWEQNGVSMFTHPKEVTIDQMAEEVGEPDANGKRKIVYTPYDGPERVNLTWGYPDWNVFPEWHEKCPRAAELAEVFSLGRIMWMLFEQREQSNEPTEWTGRSRGIPKSWVDMANLCQEVDPNARPELDEVVEFWARESTKYAVEEARDGQGHAQPLTFKH